MICEIHNWVLDVLYWCFGSIRQPVDKVSALDATVIFIVFVLFMLVVSWWLVPLMRLIDKLSDTTFHCEINKK